VWSFTSNVINGHFPETGPTLPDKSIGVGAGAGDGAGAGAGAGVGAGVGLGVGDGVGAGVGAGVGVGVGAGGGAGVGVGAAAGCVSLTAVPATGSEASLAAPAFATTTTRSVASPCPESGETVAHATSLLAVHAHAVCAWTDTDNSPPVAGTALVVGVTSYRQGAAAWVIDS
jgi:hypothetical protein